METITINFGTQNVLLTKEKVEKDCAGGKKITDEAFSRFANLCKEYKLNPFTRDAYIIVSEWSGKSNTQIMVGKDGYFKMADSNPNYDGMEDGIIVLDKNGEVQELEGCFLPPNCKLLGGWAKAYSKNRTHGKVAKVNLSEYSSGKNLWASKPTIMINKVAKVTALRDLFPQTFAGTYAEGELDLVNQQVGNTTPEKKAQAKMPQATKESEAKATPPTLDTKPKGGAILDNSLSTSVNYVTKNGEVKQKTIEEFIKASTSLEQQEKCKVFLKEEGKKGESWSKACNVVVTALEKGIYSFPTTTV